MRVSIPLKRLMTWLKQQDVRSVIYLPILQTSTRLKIGGCGCRIEQLQLETQARLLNALATYSIVAWRLMWLTYRARLTPDDLCTTILQPTEWKILRRKFEPKNRSKKPPTIRQAVRWIAQLGGFLARKGDGEPGLKTLWRGIGVLDHFLEGAQLAAKP
jgi:Transposase Tn5 dimerisation domain